MEGRRKFERAGTVDCPQGLHRKCRKVVLSCQFSVLGSQFSVLSSQLTAASLRLADSRGGCLHVVRAANCCRNQKRRTGVSAPRTGSAHADSSGAPMLARELTCQI